MIKLQETPRFSINKLAEYMNASPRRRRRLILDQMIKPQFKVALYDDARRIIVRYLCDSNLTGAWLLEWAAELRDQAAPPGIEPQEKKALICSARAIEAFVRIGPQVRVGKLVAVAGKRRKEALEISGVQVSVTPDVSYIQQGTELRLGGIKLHFSTANKLDAEALKHVSTLLYAYFAEQGQAPKVTDCRAVDVFGELLETAPRAYKARLKNIEAACEEIAERWPGLLKVAEAEKAAAEAGAE